MIKALVRICAGVFWILLLLSPLMIAFSIGQSGPASLPEAIARAIAAAPAFALYLLGAPEAPARAAGIAIAASAFACAMLQVAEFVRRRLGLGGRG